MQQFSTSGLGRSVIINSRPTQFLKYLLNYFSSHFKNLLTFIFIFFLIFIRVPRETFLLQKVEMRFYCENVEICFASDKWLLGNSLARYWTFLKIQSYYLRLSLYIYYYIFKNENAFSVRIQIKVLNVKKERERYFPFWKLIFL